MSKATRHMNSMKSWGVVRVVILVVLVILGATPRGSCRSARRQGWNGTRGGEATFEVLCRGRGGSIRVEDGVASETMGAA
ncbi:unnamed protein product [Vitrella brassicaformis CCMP3155]|uniref:Uncharacterized protein n=1 Tax=Vitrella brassicaformis (strain CCMP3155) TaxID=1169540 RepID=A0A0G4GAZ4_VITBC|nr:unnamed protein product [Vitrella brassicaformis CCMP3155]|eukprot:CEM25986.1 unnamed protein product [Vitrella brassicaformis CCMP3155]